MLKKQVFKCSGCNSECLKYPSQLKRLDIVFCSVSCKNKNYKKVFPNWKPANSKIYNHICIQCNKSFTTIGSDYNAKIRSYCSRNCQATGIDRRAHTIETKSKLSKAQLEYCKKYGSQAKNKVPSLQTRAKLSKAMSGKEPKWKGRVFQYNGINGLIKMRSSYELAYANHLDILGINWVYEPRFELSDGRMFAPDFQLNNGDIIEIKGYLSEKGQEKWELFCNDYPHLNKKMLFKNDLKNIGILR